jgi:hypothetical protein
VVHFVKISVAMYNLVAVIPLGPAESVGGFQDLSKE